MRLMPNALTLTRAWEPETLGLGIEAMCRASMGPFPSLISGEGQTRVSVCEGEKNHEVRTYGSHGCAHLVCVKYLRVLV